MAGAERSCWCGSDSLVDFGPDYLRCTACETLVGQAGLTDEETRVRHDDVDYYGKRYWLEHQRETLGLPDIYARVRQDLPERCVHWLKSLLRYRRPPAKVLEVGAGHGAYTALLRWAGYDATALDLSPWVAKFAKARFGVPYLVGPVEDQALKPHSFDLVVANDLLEHLADPRSTMRHCVDLLKPSGVLMIQTPEYPAGRGYEELVAEENAFLEHVRRAKTEHLYLFSRGALEQLLGEVGIAKTAFEEPVYPYDMLCVASPTKLRRTKGDPKTLEKEAPLVLALIDGHDAWRGFERESTDRLVALERLDAALKESEADRAKRLQAMESLEGQLKQVEMDRGARLEVIERLDKALGESEDDRRARLELIERLNKALKESESDRQARLERIQQLDAALKESEADRRARLKVIERLNGQLQGSENDRRERLELIERLSADLEESENDRQARLEVIEQLDAALKKSEAELEKSVVRR